MSPVQIKTVKRQLANVWDAAVAAIQALAEQVKRGKVNGELTEVQELLGEPVPHRMNQVVMGHAVAGRS